jgi:TonB family protein
MASVLISILHLALATPLLSAAELRGQESERVYSVDEVSKKPVPTRRPPVMYPAEAQRDGVTGSVTVEGVVGTDGKVHDVRLVRSLRADLDREAVKNFSNWEFTPGRLQSGEAVAVRLSHAISYSLQARPDPVYDVGPGISAPRVLTKVEPVYSDEDRAAGRSGEVGVECVVRRNGTCSDIVVTKRLYPSLDEAAVAALKQWRFKPGARGLADVSVRIQLTMSFEMR